MPYRAPKKHKEPSKVKPLHLIIGFVVLLVVPRIFWMFIHSYAASANTTKEKIQTVFNILFLGPFLMLPIGLFVLYGIKWSSDFVSLISKRLWENQANLPTQKDEEAEDKEEKEDEYKEDDDKENTNEHRPSFFVFHLALSLPMFYVTSRWLLLGGDILVFWFMVVGVIYSWASNWLKKQGLE